MTAVAEQRTLAVLGSPIAHSQSPALHSAAYAALGLAWNYERHDIDEAGLREFITSRDFSWRGLSLTMPLKNAVRPLLHEEDPVARATGAVNTVLFDGFAAARRLRGFNTDVAGIVRAFAEAGILTIHRVEVIGAGATAASAVAAAADMGAEQASVFARTPAKAEPLRAVGQALGVAVSIRPLDELGQGSAPDVLISTLPGSAASSIDTRNRAATSVLFDVAYDPWPSPLARRWAERGTPVISGLAMLVHQALVQVRIFTGGDPTLALADEDEVLRAMWAAVMKPTNAPPSASAEASVRES